MCSHYVLSRCALEHGEAGHRIYGVHGCGPPMRDAEPAGGSPRTDESAPPAVTKTKKGGQECKSAKGPPKQKVPRSSAQGFPTRFQKGSTLTSPRCGSGTPALHTRTAYKGINARGVATWAELHCPPRAKSPWPSQRRALRERVSERRSLGGMLSREPHRGPSRPGNSSDCPAGTFCTVRVYYPLGGTRRLFGGYVTYVLAAARPRTTHTPFPP